MAHMSLMLDLVRHADAQQRAPGSQDIERSLSTLGERQVLRLSERLLERGQLPTLVLCSPARRAQQTLAALGYDIVTAARTEPRIYEAGLDELLALIAEIQPLATRAMIIGHNPGLQDLLSYLVGPRAPGMATASHARVRLPSTPVRPLRGSGALLEHRDA